MSKTKFYSCKTTRGNKTINVSNIASIEQGDNETTITLNVKKDAKKNISFKIKETYNKVSGDINKILNQ